jgi:acetyl-CoA carboxylase biotin carboxyl carrier protein
MEPPRETALLTFEQIKELIGLVADRKLQNLEIERAGFRLRIEGQGTVASTSSVAAEPAAAFEAAPTLGTLPASSAPAAAQAAPAGPPAGSHVMTSPIVGTFYRAPSPDAPPFAEVGSRVHKGQVLCIIEAMKLMNEIECDVDGTVLDVYPQNAQAVEFGEPLFAIRTS